jgi:light-regulated signal transduction histidine kinase (bacteriophytochrome)
VSLQANSSAEVVRLIATLHETERRIEELTAGEVDSVMDTSGRVSLLRNAQEELRVSEAAKKSMILELESANESLEAFSYSVSHDLRTPLSQIIGMAELLQRRAGPSLSAEHFGDLTTLLDSALRMSDLIDTLLEFSHARHGEMCKAEVDCNHLVAEVLGDFKVPEVARNIEWEIHSLPPVSADRGLLRMVWVNLVSNAVKFTGRSTKPHIEIGCIPGEAAETVFYVRDNGAGFDPASADQLFGVFKRLHSQSEFKGTGIGLASVQRIIHRHGGRIWADGAVDRGATFYFSIPIPRDEAAAVR